MMELNGLFNGLMVYVQGSKIGKPDSLGRVEIIVRLVCLRTNKPDGAGLLF